MRAENKAMRDVFIEALYGRMHKNRDIFFLSADFGSPKLDILRRKFKDRFINVGIAEQNLINIATGLALEGFTVYAYAIAPFLTMRAFEQIRVNLSLLAQLKKININLIGVGAGLSYDVSGPTHHCLEDLSIMRTLPNIAIFSPSDWLLCKWFVEYSLKVNTPKYIRLDGKALPQIYGERSKVNISDGFFELKKGKDLCLVSSGYMTHTAIEIANSLGQKKIGVVDVFLLRPINERSLLDILARYGMIVTLEEGFINKGGLDSLILGILNRSRLKFRFKNIGFTDRYIFDVGSREYLHKLNKLDEKNIKREIVGLLKNRKNGEELRYSHNKSR